MSHLTAERTASPGKSPPEVVARRASLPRLSVHEVLMVVAWFALLAGLWESTWFAVQRHLLGQLIFAGNEIFWAAPIAQYCTALLLATPLFWAAHRTVYCTEALVAAPFMFLATLNAAMLVPHLHYVAELVLALGAAAQLSRWIEAHPGRLLQRVRTTIKPIVTVVAVLWIVTTMGPMLRERKAESQLADVPAETPNVLLVVLDTVGWKDVDLTGDVNFSRTPKLQRLAAQGVVFRRAHATCPWTLPSHASMLTGRLPHEMTAGWKTALDDRFPTLPEWMKNHGFRTGAFIGNTVYSSEETGLGRGFLHFEDYRVSAGQLMLSTAWGRYLAKDSRLLVRLGITDLLGRRRASDVIENCQSWIERDKERPFFAMVNLFDAHDPYVAPTEFQRYRPQTLRERVLIKYWWIVDKQKVTEDQVAIERAAYEDCIAYLDEKLGDLFEYLDTSKRLKNTIVIVTADHGEHFGDHNLYGHGNSLYQALIHVPLIVRYPDGRRASQLDDRWLSLRDLPASIVDLVAPGTSHPFPGTAVMSPSQFDTNAPTPPVFSQVDGPAKWPPCGGRSPAFRGAMHCVIDGNLKYILNGDGVEEVYNLVKDEAERNNLIDTLDVATLQRLRQLIAPHQSPPLDINQSNVVSVDSAQSTERL